MIHLIWLLCFTALTSSGLQAEKISVLDEAGLASGTCSTLNDVDSLSGRVNSADVVVTGTIVSLIKGQSSTSNEKSSRKAVGVIRIWRVVKGSLSGITNISNIKVVEKPEKSNASVQAMEASGKDHPLVQIHGLWNNKVCGTSVGEGETRVFFLKKFEDVRTDDDFSVAETVGEKLAKVFAEEPAALTESKGKKKDKKNKKGKKKNKTKKKTKKEKDRIKKKKNKLRRGVGKVKLHRKLPKRSADGHEKKKSGKKSRHKREAGHDAKAVLVVNSEPARINLSNLNMIENLVKVPVS